MDTTIFIAMFQPPIKVDFRITPEYIIPDPENVDFVIGETDFSGRGRLAGSVRSRGETAAGFFVDLYEEASNRLISSTTTDSVGFFEFPEIEHTFKYFMIIKDPEGMWEHRVSSKRVPSTT
jgi:hypothetical protein